ncbi:glycerol-3-phosphate dehydrogenase [Rhodovulum steppense]|uniref:Glycerol-3-phosphate dehydrogenase n=1 Tax=Rhodovulum steppense TaxID=540251 RepID=A0A4R1Z380_9RHOB|nr:glycerol-3-phosphate dehydrogenase [Rhodovulum steppense]TCM88125.1 homodimeric glycerol 3-phosphate dehydrogenase (quinone) [Rhodovulum steppense]
MAQGDGGPVDLFVIGGGVNGCGIARDAAGRGLSVCLAEMGDLASATSSASTKLFHGGLRYLDYFEFRLVREALVERETLLRAMPHISWPMRFVLPYHRDMRFEAATPAARLLARAMPWAKGRRPAWLIRLGLGLYDGLAPRRILPGTRSLDLAQGAEGAALQPQFRRAFEYSDCWVEDSRLVVLNARDAAARGATILTRTRVVSARREDGLWRIETQDTESGARRIHRARALVNAAGPWAGAVIEGVLGRTTGDRVRLVRGSHIVTRRLFAHDRCYLFQGRDGRVVFAIPYETDFTLIGTTDIDHPDPDTPPVCTEAERDYLIGFVNRYLRRPVTPGDVVRSFSGLRPLHDDGAASATAASRDYTLRLEAEGAPVLHVFGGKITTYRRLAEAALARLSPHLPGMAGSWTAGVALPGGDFPVDGVAALVAGLRADCPFLTQAHAVRLVRAYGTEARALVAGAQAPGDLGRAFGATLTAREVDWLMRREYARTAEDVIWRRSKLGLRLTADEVAELERWMADRRRGVQDAA